MMSWSVRLGGSQSLDFAIFVSPYIKRRQMCLPLGIRLLKAAADLPTAGTDLPTANSKILTAGTDLPTADLKILTAGTDLPTANLKILTADLDLPTANLKILTAELDWLTVMAKFPPASATLYVRLYEEHEDTIENHAKSSRGKKRSGIMRNMLLGLPPSGGGG
jgi:hypothetical protein